MVAESLERQTDMASISITANDGHTFACWYAKAKGQQRGSIVVLQEIFGVNHHIQAVCESLAVQGYEAYAPALFDRLEPGFATGYSKEEIANALKFLPKLNWDLMISDVLATVQHARASLNEPVSVLGFCLGASVAYLAGQRGSGIAAVVGYYGGQIVNHLQEPPRVPSLLHFGETDHTIPMSDVKLKDPNVSCMFTRLGMGSIAMNERPLMPHLLIWPGTAL
jgi:carboxymethylenebutenolidase